MVKSPSLGVFKEGLDVVLGDVVLGLETPGTTETPCMVFVQESARDIPLQQAQG